MLLLDTNGWTTQLENLDRVPVPSTTDSYTPVPHRLFLEEVFDRLPGFGLKVAERQLALARKGQHLFGVLTCNAGRESESYRLAIGLRNSYDKSLACGLVAGVRVLVCSNLAFSGEVTMQRRHTRNVLMDLPDCIDEMLAQVRTLRSQQAEEIDRLSERFVTPGEVHDVLVRAVRAKALPASKIPGVLREWDEPRHAEFAPRTAWSLLNAVTEVQKSRSMAAQLDVGLMKVFRQAMLS